MARYEHLPIFKEIYDLNLYFYQVSRGFPKDIKYGLAQEIRVLLTFTLDQVISANSDKNKLPYLSKAEKSLEIIKVKVRMLYDLKTIKLQRYQYISTSLINISKQFTAWKNWSENGRS